MSDKIITRYNFLYGKKKQSDWENLCIRCGACCGAYDDPCEDLKKEALGNYRCRIYNRRFGLRKTVGGEEFMCVPIREIIHSWWPGNHLCAYKKGQSICRSTKIENRK